MVAFALGWNIAVAAFSAKLVLDERKAKAAQA